jgi:hypothetical protein
MWRSRPLDCVKDHNVNLEEHQPLAVRPPCDGLPRQENGPGIDYLQRTIAHLLLKNERMRFELFALRQKIAHIDNTVFGAGSDELQERLPSFLVDALGDLCDEETAGAQHRAAMQAAAENGMTARTNIRSIRRMHQTRDSIDRRER